MLTTGGAFLMLRTRNYGKGLECVEGRRRRQGAFERGRSRAPWIVAGEPLLGEGVIDQIEEQNGADAGDIGPEGGNPVPQGERVRIIDVAARHARETKEMLREESEVDADEDHPKMNLGNRLIIHIAGHLWEPIIKPGEYREHGPD